MRVLITQSAQDASASIAALEARGHHVLAVPLVVAERPDPPKVNLAGAQAFLVTGAEGARALADNIGVRTFPVFADSEVTAAALRRFGFKHVEAAKDDAADLARLVEKKITPAGGALIYACSTAAPVNLSAMLGNMGFAVRAWPLYTVKRVEQMPEALRSALQSREIDAALFLSADEARAFVALVQRWELETLVRELPCVAATPIVAAPLRALKLGGISVPQAADLDTVFAALDVKLVDRVEEERAAREARAREEVERQRAEQERQAREQAERERLAQERAAKERAEQDRLAAERVAREQAAREKAEQERQTRERRESEEKIAREKVEQERIAREKAEAERKHLEAEQAEKEREARRLAEQERIAEERAAKERAAQDRAERERLERERLAAEKAERDRLAAENAAAERAERERLAKERAEQERLERERLAIEKAERDRVAAEKAAAEKIERERLAKERAEQERVERERLAAERAERERVAVEKAAAEKAERERLAKERAEQERIERERLAAEKAERERIAREEIARAKSEQERLTLVEAERLRQERERMAAEKAERDRQTREQREREEQAARDKTEAERLERERLAKEQAERNRIEGERLAAEKAERDRIAAEKAAAEKAERDRIALEKAALERIDAERLAAEKTERERIAREKAEAERVERERLTREQAERDRISAEKAAIEKAERERQAREQREREERVAREKAEKARIAAEYAEHRRLEKTRESEKRAEEKALRRRLVQERKAAAEAARPPSVGWGVRFKGWLGHRRDSEVKPETLQPAPAPTIAVAPDEPSATIAPPAVAPPPIPDVSIPDRFEPEPPAIKTATPPAKKEPHVPENPPPTADEIAATMPALESVAETRSAPRGGGRAARLLAEDAADLKAKDQRFKYLGHSDAPEPEAVERPAAASSTFTSEASPPQDRQPRGGIARAVALFVVLAAIAALVMGTASTWVPRVTQLVRGTPSVESASPVQTDITALKARVAVLEGQAVNTVSPEALNAAKQDLNQRLAALEARRGGQDGEAVTSLGESLSSQAKQLTAVSARIATLEAAIGNSARLEDLSKRLNMLEGRSAEANSVLALSDRVTALETSARRTMVEQSTNIALLTAVAQWREAVLVGHPFALELQTAKSLASRTGLAIDDSGFADTAAKGIPTLAELQRGFNAAAAAAMRADAIPDDTVAWYRRILDRVLSIATVRRLDGDAAGTSTSAILARAQRRLTDGDLGAAVTEASNLTGSAATAMMPWLAPAKTRVAAERAAADATIRAVGAVAGTAKPDQPAASTNGQ